MKATGPLYSGDAPVWGLQTKKNEAAPTASAFQRGWDQFYDMSGDGQLARLPVTLEGRPLRNLNELEWVDGEIWANVWQTDEIARIDPGTGDVVGLIDLSGLLPDEDRLRDTDVLNGIAIDPITQAIWVTGKRWPWLFEITLENDAD